MPNSQATIENLLRWKTDQQSVDVTVRANQKVEASSTRAALNFGSAAQAAQALGLSTAQMQQLGLATEKTAQSVGYLTRRLEEAARVRSFQGDATGGLRDAAFGGARGGNDALVRGLFNARQAAIALPGVGYQSPLTIGIRGLEIAAAKTGASVGQLGAAVGIVGATAAVVAVAFDRFNQQLEGSQKLLAGALAANENYYDALGTLTSEQVDEQIATLQRLRPVLEQQVNELQNALDSAFAQAQQTPLGDIGARALFNQLPTGALKEALDEASAALNSNIQTEARLTQGREAGAFAANDVAEAERELADLRKQLADVRTSREVSSVNAELAAQRLTSDERQKRIAELGEEIAILRARSNADDLSATTQLKLIDQINDLEAEYGALIAVTDSYGDRLARQAQYTEALKTQTDNYFDALQREGEIRDALAQNAQDVAESLADYNRKSLQETSDYHERIAELETDAADRRAEIAQDAQDRIAEIESQAAIDRAEAIGYRDADALRKANERAAQQKKQVDKQEDRQIDNLEKSLDKQVRTAQRSYERQQRALEDAKNREIYALQTKYQRLQADLTNAIYAEQQIALTGAGTQRIIHTQMWQDLNYLAVSWVFNTVNTVRSILQNSGFFGASVNGSQVQQIATQAARNYLNERLVNGRWITA